MAATVPPTAMPTIADVWIEEEEAAGGGTMMVGVEDEVAPVVGGRFGGAVMVPVIMTGDWVVVMTWVTGWWDVMVMVDVTSIVVLALRTMVFVMITVVMTKDVVCWVMVVDTTLVKSTVSVAKTVTVDGAAAADGSRVACLRSITSWMA